jgi:hypothetical protein
MIDIADELHALVAKFDEQSIEYALCGGMAMAVHDRQGLQSISTF